MLVLGCLGGLCACGGQEQKPNPNPDDKPPIVDPNPPDGSDDETERTVTYHLNGGTGKALDVFTIGEGLSSLPVPEKKGMTFVGWYKNVELSGDKVESISAEETGDVELWASYSHNTYSVSADTMSASGVTFGGESSAVHGTDYTFTVSFETNQPLSVAITAGGEAIAFVKNADGSYTVSGDDITGDLAVTFAFSHVWLYTTAADHVVYGEDTMAKKNEAYTFSVSAETGYKITDVTVTEEGGSSLQVQKNDDGTFTVPVSEKPITIGATAQEISYAIQLSYGQDKTLSLGNVTYTEQKTLTGIGNISDFGLPQHYDFLGWATEANGTPVHSDGSSVSKLTVEDGATVTLYAITRGEEYSVDSTGLRFLELAEGDAPEAHFDEDFVFAFKDEYAGYYIDLSITVNGQPCEAEYNAQTNEYTIDKAKVTGSIVIAGERYVTDPTTYEGITQKIEIADVFENGNSYSVAAALRQDGIYFKANVTQNSITQDEEKSAQNLVFVDAIRFVFGKKDGSAWLAVPNNSYYFGVNVCGRVDNLDRALAKVTGERGNYEIVYEGFVSYETLVSRTALGYATADFAGDAYKTAQVYCGVRLVNPQNFKTAQDAIFTANAQDGITSRGNQGLIVSADGNDSTKGNYNKITQSGITSLLPTEGVDGVVEADEYGTHGLVYSDTNTTRNNKLEMFGKKTKEGLRIAVRVTSRSLVFFNGEPKNGQENVDYVMISYRNTDGNMANIFLYASGRAAASDMKANGFAFCVGIDKSQAGTVTTQTNGNAAALVAQEGSHLITTYEILVPYGYLNGTFEDGEVYVKFRHRKDQAGPSDDEISYTGRNSGGSTVWEYTNGDNVSWPNDWKDKKTNLVVTENGIFDLHRTVKFDNTATGNSGKTFNDITNANVYFTDMSLPDVGTPAVGYRFLGWSLSADGEILQEVEKLPMGWLPDESGVVTLYARYEEAEYNLTVSDEGNKITESTCAEGDPVKLWQDYTVTIQASQPETGKVNVVEITVGGVSYIPQVDGNTYTVLGKDITGDIAVTVREIDAVSYNVTFAEDSWAMISGNDKVYEGVAYTFTLSDSSLVGAAKCGGVEIPVTNLGNGNFSIAANYITGDLAIRAKQPITAANSVTFELHRNEGEGLHAYFPDFVQGKSNAVVKVSVDGKEVADGAEYDESANAFRIDTQKFGVAIGDTEHTLTIETEDVVYTQTFKLVTMVIMNKEELLLVKTQYFQGTYEGHMGSAVTTPLRDGYFVLGADINEGGEYFEFTMSPVYTIDGTGAPNGDEGYRMSWFGVFDGAGHTIYNVQTGMGGMFGILRSNTSAIKNLAVVGGKLATGGDMVWQSTGAASGNKFEGGNVKNTGFLVRAVKGATIENVYVEMAEMPQADRFGVIGFVVDKNIDLGDQVAVLKNIVINIKTCTTTGSDRHAVFGVAFNNPTVENVFAYGDIDASFGNKTNTDKPTVSRSDMSGNMKGSATLSADFAEQISGKGSFTVKESKLYFGKVEIDTIA